MSESLEGVNEDELRTLVLERDVRNFLKREANLLDDRKLEAWFELIDDDIEYRMPRRLMREHEAAEFDEEGYFFDEDYGSLKARVERFDSSYAWAERPPARTRRYVTNVIVEDRADPDLSVSSNVLLYYSQGDTSEYELVSVRRLDTLRRTDEDFTIASREILPDHTTLGISKISTFL